MSFPPGTEMFQFPGFALKTLCIQELSTCLTRLTIVRRQSIVGYQVGFPIRKSADQRVLSPPHGLSQSATSFIASCRQGIHRTPFSRLIRSRSRKTVPDRTAIGNSTVQWTIESRSAACRKTRGADRRSASRTHRPKADLPLSPRPCHALRTSTAGCHPLAETCTRLAVSASRLGKTVFECPTGLRPA